MLHILTLLADNRGKWLNSNYIASSLNINPALVRKELTPLKAAHWVVSKEGNTGGVQLDIEPGKLKLSDIFLIAKGEENVLSLGKNAPNPDCPIGKDINAHLLNLYSDIDATIVQQLEGLTLAEFRGKF